MPDVSCTSNSKEDAARHIDGFPIVVELGKTVATPSGGCRTGDRGRPLIKHSLLGTSGHRGDLASPFTAVSAATVPVAVPERARIAVLAGAASMKEACRLACYLNCLTMLPCLLLPFRVLVGRLCRKEFCSLAHFILEALKLLEVSPVLVLLPLRRVITNGV